jgi:hypothetical protein
MLDSSREIRVSTSFFTTSQQSWDVVIRLTCESLASPLVTHVVIAFDTSDECCDSLCHKWRVLVDGLKYEDWFYVAKYEDWFYVSSTRIDFITTTRDPDQKIRLKLLWRKS